MANLESVYETPLQSLVVCKPDGCSTVRRQVDVDYLQTEKLDFVPCPGFCLGEQPRLKIAILESEKNLCSHMAEGQVGHTLGSKGNF